jgi:hypothetical protein
MSVFDDTELRGRVTGVGAESVWLVVKLMTDMVEDGGPTTESSGIEVTAVDFDITSGSEASGFDGKPVTGTFFGAGLVYTRRGGKS